MSLDYNFYPFSIIDSRFRKFQKKIIAFIFLLCWLSFSHNFIAFAQEGSQECELYPGDSCSFGLNYGDRVTFEVEDFQGNPVSQMLAVKPDALSVRTLDQANIFSSVQSDRTYLYEIFNDKPFPVKVKIEIEKEYIQEADIGLSCSPFNISCSINTIPETRPEQFRWMIIVSSSILIISLVFIVDFPFKILNTILYLIKGHFLKPISRKSEGLIQNFKDEKWIYVLCIPGIFVAHISIKGAFSEIAWLIQFFFCLILLIYFFRIVKPQIGTFHWAIAFLLITVSSTTLLISLFGINTLSEGAINNVTLARLFFGEEIKASLFEVNSIDKSMAVIEILWLALPQIVISGLSEELLKALPFLILLFQLTNYKMSHRTCMVLGIASGLGFAIVEGVTYSIGWIPLEQPQLIFRLVSGPILHAVFSGFASWYVGEAILNNDKKWNLVVEGILRVSILHIIYNLSLFIPFGSLIIAIFAIWLFLGKINSERDQERKLDRIRIL